MNDTTITLRGYVGGDVIVREAGDTQVANFRVAHTPRLFNRAANAWYDGTTQWYSVAAWRQLGENVAWSIGKGDPVFVHGRLVVKEWTDKDGNQRSTFEVEAESVGHDLNRGTTIFRRPQRPEQPKEQDTEPEAPSWAAPGVDSTPEKTDPLEGWDRLSAAA
ncbi:MAG: single-stranded DNA-binding protein [Nocardioides sp.]|uniref:single-stranded DNA-binding protein n=1 Tax=Nocardioides sp. TaxID=35761 RepID=UPI0039E63E19